MRNIQTSQTNLLSYLELLAANIIWGGTFVTAKYALEALSPILLALIRFVISSLFFLPIIYLSWRRGQYVKRRDFRTIILLGLLGVTFFYVFQFLGLKYTTATNVSLLITLIPIFTLLFSSKLLKEKFGPAKIGGIGISFLGAVLVITNGSLNISTRTNDIIGALFILSNVICWVLYTVIGKKILKQYPAGLITSYAVIIGTLLMIPMAILWGSFKEIANLNLAQWISVFYLGIFGSFIGYLLWYHGLKKVKASTASTFIYLIPLVTIILASSLLGEVITLYTLIGGIMIILGVFLVTRY